MILSFKQVINKKKNYFVRKIWLALLIIKDNVNQLSYKDFKEFHIDHLLKLGSFFDAPKSFDDYPINPKLHTIRAGNRWHAGMIIDFFINARTKKMFRFAPKIPCVSVQEINFEWQYDKHCDEKYISIFIDGQCEINGYYSNVVLLKWVHELAINDGFESAEDFLNYFNKDFTGQIIHWTNKTY